MTIGIAAFGPQAGAGVLAALRAVEGVGRGAIGGFVSLAALTEDGRLLRATCQQGGAGALFTDAPPDDILAAPLVGLISSGPNRPEPLAAFVAAEPGVGLVTGHRMPHTPAADGVPLNAHVLRKMKQGADPQSAIDRVIARFPEMDAGFLAVSVDGRIGLGSMPGVLSRRDHGAGMLEDGAGPARVASIHNAIQPHRLIALAANEVALDTMLRPAARAAWVTIPAGVALAFAPEARILVGPDGVAQRILHPHRPFLSGEWSVGLGERVAVVADGAQLGWLGYEPYLVVSDGRVLSVDGQDAVSAPLLPAVP